MAGFIPPLHIDLIPRERQFKNERQYWFMTWILGPDRIIVWCKLYNGWWRLETPKKYSMFLVPPDNQRLNDPIFAKYGEHKEAMDATLLKFMHENNYSEQHHFYWLKDSEIEPIAASSFPC